MPVWLSRIFKTRTRVSNPYDRDRFTRKDFLIIVLCIGFMVVLGKDFSLQITVIVAIITVAIIILIYLPKLGLSIIGLAGCAFLFREASGIQHWQALVPWVALGFILLCGLIYEDDHLILQQLDSLHKKIDKLHERIEEIEAERQ